jgi:hypothetical protein
MRVVPAHEFRRGPVVRRHHIGSSRNSGGSTLGRSPGPVAAPEQSLKAV